MPELKPQTQHLASRNYLNVRFSGGILSISHAAHSGAIYMSREDTEWLAKVLSEVLEQMAASTEISEVGEWANCFCGAPSSYRVPGDRNDSFVYYCAQHFTELRGNEQADKQPGPTGVSPGILDEVLAERVRQEP